MKTCWCLRDEAGNVTLQCKKCMTRLEFRCLEMRLRMKTSGKKYWILFHVDECPVCFGGSEWRERIYDRPKPKDPAKRYEYTQHYDWCNG